MTASIMKPLKNLQLKKMSQSPRPFAPLDVFQKTIQYFPTVSINLIVRNSKGEFLFVKRKNNPAKGLWWVPGGRVLNGESMKEAGERVLKQETGLDLELKRLSRTYLEERFGTEGFDESDRKIYPETVTCVHYLATAALAELGEDQEIRLDSQSESHLWSATLPHEHPYMKAYFDLMKDFL